MSLDQPCSGYLMHFCHLGISFIAPTPTLTPPSCNRPRCALESIISCYSPLFFFSCFTTFFNLFISSLQCCLACFALLFHLISSFRSFSPNPYCLFQNFSILFTSTCLSTHPLVFFWSIHPGASGTLPRRSPKGAGGERRVSGPGPYGRSPRDPSPPGKSIKLFIQQHTFPQGPLLTCRSQPHPPPSRTH